MKFTDLSLRSEKLKENIAAIGFTEATPIQAAVIPLAVEGKDISGLSRTGTGKTFAFLIPTIDSLLANEDPKAIALCLAPTRELALQIEQEALKLLKGTNISPVSTVGGMPIAQQVKAIQNDSRLVIGTPGRVIDLMKSKVFSGDNVTNLVFDEADRMFDMGFIDDMRFIMNRINRDRQILLFSATMNFSVLNMMYEFNCDPVEINISKDKLTADGIAQYIYHISDHEKDAALIHLCNQTPEGSIIVFVNYRERVLTVADTLNANGIPATGISSLLRQDKRNRIIDGFKKGKFRALIATDVASRGLDIDDVALVVNYHLPEEAANYVHRIGRTARAGKSGIAVAIAGPGDAYAQLRIEDFLGNKIPVKWFGENELNAVAEQLKLNRKNDMNNPRNRNQNRGQNRDNNRRNGNQNGNRRDSNESGANRDRDPAMAYANADSGKQTENARHDRNERGDRNNRNDRSDRSDRNDRGDRPERFERSQNSHGRNNSSRRGNNRQNRDRGPRENQEKRKPPYPITGNPTIYCTVTGKAKSTPVNSPQREPNLGATEKRVNLLQKIGSTVSSIFVKK